jgi:hypothetical protein
MKRDFSALDLPPAIAAAHRRTPRHLRRRAKESENNYIAESIVRPRKRSQNRRRPGAAAGNLNAFKHGAFTAERLAFRRYCWALIRETRALLKLRALFIERKRLESRAP